MTTLIDLRTEVAVTRVVNVLVAPLRLISRSAALLAAALLLIGGWGMTAFLLTARMDTDATLRSHWIGTSAIGIPGVYLLAVWVTCTTLAVFTRSNGGNGSLPPSGYGADWQADLDQRGCIAATHGYPPDRLREAKGQPLLSALDLEPSVGSARIILGVLEARSCRDGLQVTFVTHDGQEQVHRLSIEPRSAGGYSCFGRDVTNEIRLAAKLDAASAASCALIHTGHRCTRAADESARPYP
jgi:hypothetical protein